MGDRGELLRELRDASLRDRESLLPDERTKLIRLASTTEHVFMLIAQLAHECRQASLVDEAFLAHADLPDMVELPDSGALSDVPEPVQLGSR